MTPKNVLLERKEPGIAVVTIARPKTLNALNTEALRELKAVLYGLSEDDSVRVVVMTGEGEKAFIAGADITEMAGKSPAEGEEFARLGQDVTKLLELMPKPTIAAVNGFALGGGTEMAISCDFIVASENAVFGQPEVSLGIIPGFGATVRLSKFVGLPMAKELIFSGRRVKADEALRIGLANHVVPLADLMPKVLELAESMSRNSARAVHRAKALMNSFGETVGLQDKLGLEAHEFGLFFGTPDQMEGMGAFVEKRKADFFKLPTGTGTKGAQS